MIDPFAPDPSPRSGANVATLSVAALVLDFMLVAMLYNAVTPVFENPDESYHYFFAQHVSHTGRLPVQTADPEARGPWEQEGSQPPLFHLLASPLVRLAGANLSPDTLWYNHQNSMGHPAVVGNDNRFIHPPDSEGWPWHGYALAVRLGRLLSTLFGAMTVVGVWAIALRVLGGRRWLALAAAALVAFNPQFLAVSAAFSNDAAIIALATVALALLLRVADEGGVDTDVGNDGGRRDDDGEDVEDSNDDDAGRDDERIIPLLAVVAGLAPLAKLSGIAVVGFTLATLAGLARRRRGGRLLDGGFLARTAGPVVLATAVLSGWWYARNIVLYGDIMGISFMHPGLTERWTRLSHWLAGLPAELEGVWWSTWGIFGWFTVLLPTWMYHAITALAIAAVAGLALAARRRPEWLDGRRLAWLGLWGAVVAASLLRWLSITKGGHGRLLFPAIAFGSIALVSGWRMLAERMAVTRRHPPAPDRVDRVFAAAVIVVMYVFALYSLLGVIRPAFAPPPVIAADAVPDGAVPAGAVFGEGLRLVAVEHPDRVAEGAPFEVALYWQTDAPQGRDGFVALRVDQLDVRWTRDNRDHVERHDPPLTQPGEASLGYPGRGNAPPSLLPPGPGIVVDRRTIDAPWLVTPDQPLAARLSVHLYDQGRAERWPMRRADESDDPAAEWSTTIAIAPRSPLRIAGAGAKAVDNDFARPEAAGTNGSSADDGATGPHALFDNGVRLYRYNACGSVESCRGFRSYEADVEIRSTPGDAMTTGIVWTVERDVGEDLSLFVHLVDAAGRQVATFDTPPATFAPLPTSLWQAGDTLYAPIDWQVPADAPPGARYRLLVGLYRAEGGARIAVADPAGRSFDDSAVPLATIVVAAP